MKAILQKLGAYDELTIPLKKETKFTHVIDNVPLKEDYNFMADLLFLPSDKRGNKYCLSMVDLATNEIDFEPLKNKRPETVLKGMEKIFKRGILKKPYASLATDAGSEFKGVFHKWLYDEDIYHKVGVPERHKQMSTVENLNKQLGILFNAYMNKKEKETGKVNKQWTEIIDFVRTELNAHRKRDLNKIQQNEEFDFKKKQKFNVGDLVFYKSEIPLNALGKKQTTKNFRVGDYRYYPEPKRIKQVFYYTGDVPHRYQLEGLTNVSYTENELKLAN